ncbi:MAG: hypothetical protein HC877_19015 [Thioploca sp.]|nr:hypothetical protein [Thioploca sp.]
METTPTTTSAISSLGTTSQALIMAHPLGAAIVGGIVIGVGTYYLMKWFKKAEPQKATA